MIVIPMAGLSQRFINAGYDKPKYMLEAGGMAVFAHVLKSFERYFASEQFLFICRDVLSTPAFIGQQCQSLGISKKEVVILSAPTRGQAETVYMGLNQAKLDPKEPITIFNIDTVRPGFAFPPNALLEADGYLEVFRGQGDGWSFAKTESAGSMKVTEVAEKRRISDLCSTGLYYFRRAHDFLDAFRLEASKPPVEWDAKELYVAPLYNVLIRKGMTIRAFEIETRQMIACGTPAEYELFKSNGLS